MAEAVAEAIHFELKHVQAVSWAELNVLSQTRKTMQPEGMDELVRAIEAVDTHGQARNELFHPIMVNSLDREATEKYVADLNLCHGTDHDVDQLRQGDDGRYKIIIAGHRRHAAIGRLIEKQGADPTLSTIPSSVDENLEFRDALRKQIDENTHQSLSVTEVARAIQATYRYGIATGSYASIPDCVRDLPFGDEKVRNALKFCELPVTLQEWVENGHLPYGSAVALQPMMAGMRNRYAHVPEDEREKIMLEYLIATGLSIINHRWSASNVRSHVNEILESWRKESDLTLFMMDELKIARAVRQERTRELFAGGINRLRKFFDLEVGKDLPLEQQEALREELENFAAKLGGAAAALSGAESPMAFNFAN